MVENKNLVAFDVRGIQGSTCTRIFVMGTFFSDFGLSLFPVTLPELHIIILLQYLIIKCCQFLHIIMLCASYFLCTALVVIRWYEPVETFVARSSLFLNL